MGGGASSQGLEEALAETFMLGRAIVAVTFPGMYRIYDFHSSKAPPIKNASPFSMFGGLVDSDEEPDDAEQQTKDPDDYKHLFSVKVGNDTIYIEDVCEVNEAGWTALHTCCMSFQTVEAGCAIIDEMVKKDASLDVKTVTGPGAFNSGWTPLHMACAYGVEPLVEKLVACGANVNTSNSYRCTPLLEACHRGFLTVVKMLLKGNVNLSYNPSDDGSATSPFVCSPSQSALAEAARCGFPAVVQALVDAGAPKDLTNHLGWAALHEACFYNRVETVRILLLSGADATLRAKCGARPYHLTALADIREMLQEMGGSEATPDSAEDKVDMIDIMRELTVGNDGSTGPVRRRQMVVTFDPETGKPTMQEVEDVSEADEEKKSGDDEDQGYVAFERRRITEGGDAVRAAGTSPLSEAKASGNNHTESKQQEQQQQQEHSGAVSPTTRGAEAKQQAALLHSGGVLGDLPAFNSSGDLSSATKSKQYSSPNKHTSDSQFDSAIEAAIEGTPSPKKSSLVGGGDGDHDGTDGRMKSDMSGKKKKKKSSNNRPAAEIPPDMPREFLCALTQMPMTDPVKSMYGHCFERKVILDWFKNQGRICPLTGAPLSESDVTDMEDLRVRITKWMLLKSMEGGGGAGSKGGPKGASGNGSDMAAPSKTGRGAAAVPLAGNDRGTADADADLYDF